MKKFILDGKNVKLSNDLRREHAKAIVDLANDYEIFRNIGSHSFPFPYTLEDAMFFIQKNREIRSTPFAIDFLVRSGEDIVGAIGLSDINYVDKNAHVGYWIGRRYWNKGYASESLGLICDFAVNELSLKRLHSLVLEYNAGSLKVMLKNGFSIEGYDRDSFLFEDRYYSFFRVGKVLY